MNTLHNGIRFISLHARSLLVASILMGLVLGFLTRGHSPRFEEIVPELRSNWRELPLHDLLTDVDYLAKQETDLAVPIQYVRSRMSDAQWLEFLQSFKNNIVPIADVLATLPLPAQEAVNACGAQYAQTLVDSNVYSGADTIINIFCIYPVPTGNRYFQQWTGDRVDEHTGEYVTTRFNYALHMVDHANETVQYDVIRVGMPSMSEGPYPILGASVPDELVLKARRASFEEAAQFFSIATQQEVLPEAVQFRRFEGNSIELFFEAQVGSSWYYLEAPFTDNVSQFSPLHGKDCSTAWILPFSHAVAALVCRLDARL